MSRSAGGERAGGDAQQEAGGKNGASHTWFLGHCAHPYASRGRDSNTGRLRVQHSVPAPWLVRVPVRTTNRVWLTSLQALGAVVEFSLSIVRLFDFTIFLVSPPPPAEGGPVLRHRSHVTPLRTPPAYYGPIPISIGRLTPKAWSTRKTPPPDTPLRAARRRIDLPTRGRWVWGLYDPSDGPRARAMTMMSVGAV